MTIRIHRYNLLLWRSMFLFFTRSQRYHVLPQSVIPDFRLPYFSPHDTRILLLENGSTDLGQVCNATWSLRSIRCLAANDREKSHRFEIRTKFRVERNDRNKILSENVFFHIFRKEFVKGRREQLFICKYIYKYRRNYFDTFGKSKIPLRKRSLYLLKSYTY